MGIPEVLMVIAFPMMPERGCGSKIYRVKDLGDVGDIMFKRLVDQGILPWGLSPHTPLSHPGSHHAQIEEEGRLRAWWNSCMNSNNVFPALSFSFSICIRTGLAIGPSKPPPALRFWL